MPGARLLVRGVHGEPLQVGGVSLGQPVSGVGVIMSVGHGTRCVCGEGVLVYFGVMGGWMDGCGFVVGGCILWLTRSTTNHQTPCSPKTKHAPAHVGLEEEGVVLGDERLEHAVDKKEGRGGGRLLPLAVGAGARRGRRGGRGRGGGVVDGVWEGGACLVFGRAVGGRMHGKPCMQMAHTTAHTDMHH